MVLLSVFCNMHPISCFFATFLGKKGRSFSTFNNYNDIQKECLFATLFYGRVQEGDRAL